MTEPVVVGRYFMCDVIGGGGMARVHVGRVLGAAGFSRIVAIKRLHRSTVADRQLATMLADEARLASRIRHPNVVPVLDVVRDGPELLLVMEYVHGASLDYLLTALARRGERMPFAIAARIGLDLLAGLQAAHEAKGERGEPLQLVHRDISPHNIVVGVDGVARIIDFGIAKAARKLSTTQAGQIKGKLAYMSPEQLRAQPLDHRTDLYAAGLVLWEMVVGHRPVKITSDNFARAVRQLLETKISPPSTLVELPAALDALIMTSLGREADERFGNAEAMANALEAACGAARTKAVASLVQEIAAPLLEERRLLIERVEQLSGQHSGAQEPRDRPDASAGDQAPTLTLDVPRPAPLHVPPALDPNEEEMPAGLPRSRGGIVALAIVTVLSLGAVLAIGVRTRMTTSAPGMTSASGSGMLPGTSVAPPPTLTLSDDSPADNASDPTPAPEPGSAVPSQAGAPHGGAPHAAPSSSAAPDCDPPFSIDKNGIRIPIRRCLQRR